jgi:hypothetical protein
VAGSLSLDRCPRCGAAFHCGFADAVPCACTTLKLDRATLAELRGRFSGCLCLRCLQALARADALPASPTPPAPRR